jgi:hypothetical protein
MSQKESYVGYKVGSPARNSWLVWLDKKYEAVLLILMDLVGTYFPDC